MYSGSTLNKYSGNLLGAHQKIDKVARRHLGRLIQQGNFPGIKAILHFEGNKGPDAIKRKSPAQDEPWHYLQPFDITDTQLIKIIESHYADLVNALKDGDKVRSAFEAAWLAHAVVDGLTPAHHYPYEEKLVELSSGREISERTTVGKKLFMPGDTASLRISNNWKMWGPKGLFTTHAAFETGVAMLIAPLKISAGLPATKAIADFHSQSLGEWFRSQAQAVADLKLYDNFYETGWTRELARGVRKELAPSLVQAVTLVWHGAAAEAGLVKVAAKS